MNYSWIVYENGLQQLLQRVPLDHCEYENICALQALLRQNIAQAKLHGDPEALYVVRRRILFDLNNLAMQVMEGCNFIELCIASCYLFKYLAHVYKIAHYARAVFRDGHVWPDQCRWIIDDFWKRPVLAEAVKGITGGFWALSCIDDRVTKLIQLVEEYERISKITNKRINNKHKEIIRHSEFLAEEMQKIDNESFKELTEWYQETVLSVCMLRPPPALGLIKDEIFPSAFGEPRQQDQEPVQQPVADRTEGNQNHMDHELHNRLVTLLLKVPDIEDFETRTDLLTGILNRLSLSRSRTVRTDISHLIGQLAEMRLQETGKLALAIFIDNAIWRVEGTELGEDLKGVRRQID